MPDSQLAKFFERRLPETLATIEALVNLESPSFDAAGSRAVADFLEGEARALKCVSAVERRTAEGCGEHLVIRAFAGENEPPVLLLGHTDTVHPRGSFRQNPTRVEGDKFYGCGIFDMKANCVLMLEILRTFDALDLKPPRPITILLSCDEEVGSATGRAIVEREARRAAFCLVCEPSAKGKAKTGRKGTANFVLKTRGVPAHAGLEPERGASAILEISRQIPQIHALADAGQGTTVNVCLIKGGTASNVIPEHAECAIDARFTSLTEAARVEREIKNLKSFDERVSIEVTGDINRPPLERNAKTLALYERAKSIADEMNYESFGETQVGGASDGNFVAALGVPVLDGLGIAGDGAHTLDEYIFIDDIPKRSALLSSLVLCPSPIE